MCSPLQPSSVRGRLSEFVERWKHITNDPYVISIVNKGYRLCFTSPPLLRETSWEKRCLQIPQDFTPIYSWYAKLQEYCQKRRLPVQIRPAGCILSCTNTSEQQEVSQVCLQKQGLSIPSSFLQSEYSPSGIYSFGVHCDRLPPSSGDFGYSIPQ